VSKKITLSLLILCLLLPLFADSIEENLEKMLEDQARQYMQPLANTAGASLNSGFYNTAKVLGPFLPNIRFGFTMTSIPSDDKTFINSDGNKTATILGDEGYDNGTYKYPDGANLSIIPMPNLTASLGLPLGNEVMVRFLPKIDLGESVGYITFWGVGLKHSVDQYLTEFFPVDLSVQYIYQSLTVGDIVTISTQSFNAQAGKKILMLTVYGGIAYEMANLKVDYTPQVAGYDGPKVKLDLDSDNEVKMTVGLRLSPFPFFDIYGDYNIAKYSSINMGVGLGF